MTILVSFFAVACNLFNGSKGNNNPFREEIISKSLPEQTLYFQSLSPTEQCALMRNKLNDTLNSTNLTDEEKEIIRPLTDIITPELYQSNDGSLNKAFEMMTESISSTLKDKYGWSDMKLFKYFETIMTEREFEEHVRRNVI